MKIKSSIVHLALIFFKYLGLASRVLYFILGLNWLRKTLGRFPS